MSSLPPWVAYVAPLALFLGLSQFDTSFGVNHYPAVYGVKLLMVGASLLLFRLAGFYPELRLEWRYMPVALTLGIVLCALWVGVDSVTPHFAFLGQRAGFDPFKSISNPIRLYGFLAERFLGLVLIVPVMEELFYRSFVLRFVIDSVDFRRVAIGTFEPLSCVIAVVIMASAHPEWLAAALFSVAMNVLLYRTRSVFACILTHGATNLALGLYVLLSHAWRFW
jgi:CAAX prenyl protease-like protein